MFIQGTLGPKASQPPSSTGPPGAGEEGGRMLLVGAALDNSSVVAPDSKPAEWFVGSTTFVGPSAL